MTTLPTNRTTANTAAEHVSDHNTIHGAVNELDANAIREGDARLTDKRVPVDGSVGDVQVNAISQSKVTGLATSLAGKANDASVVYLAGAQTVTGAKDFTGGLTVGGTTVLTSGSVVNLTGNQTVAGVKDFTSTPTVNGTAVATTTAVTAKANQLTVTAVKTSAYTAGVNEFVPVNTTSGAVTITLPTAPAEGTREVVKHVIQGATNAVTIACGGSDVFNKTGGSTTLSLALLNQAITLQYNASAGIWYVQSDDLSLTNLDARYSAIGAAPLTELVNTQSITGTYTIPAVTTATMHKLTLTGSTTITLPTAVAGQSFLVHVKQDATGGRVPTFSGATFSGGTQPVGTTTANKSDAWSFWCMDATVGWIGTQAVTNF